MSHIFQQTKLKCAGLGGPGALRRSRLLPAPLLSVALLLTLGSVPAVGAQSHEFAGTFGSTGSAAGQVQLTPESGVAVDQTNGNVYVADTGNHRVDEFSESGAFIRAWGWGVNATTPEAKPQVCTSVTGCQAGVSGPEAGEFEKPTFVAVDNTPGGSGDVYVADEGSVGRERQTVTVKASGGTFKLEYTQTLHATTTNGSNVLTAVVGQSKVGDPISGPGIPAGTTITENPRSYELKLSASATAGGREVLAVTETTPAITYNATAGQVQSALEQIAGLQGLQGTSVTGSGSAYTVEFKAYADIPQMVCDGSSLEPVGATCVVATVVNGFSTARVEKFDSSGGLVTGWGGEPAGGEIDGEIDGTISCGECLAKHFEYIEGVGVNPAGYLLVLNHTGVSSEDIFEWTQTAGEIIIDRGLAEALGHGTSDNGGPVGIAVDPAGHVYMGSSELPELEVIQTSRCNSEEPNGPCPGSNAREGIGYHENFRVDPGPAVGVGVDPFDEDVFVAHFNVFSDHSDIAEYESNGVSVETFGGNGEIVEAGIVAAYGANGDVFVADPGAGRIDVFAPGGLHDSLTVGLVGTGLGSVHSEPVGLSCPSSCSAGFPQGSEVTLTAVPPAHATFVGWTGGGCVGPAPCELTLMATTFVTAVFAQDRPTLSAVEASDIARNTAILSGAVDAEGDASSCRFEYGTTVAYGAQAPCSSSPGSGASPVAVGAGLWDLSASTTYHYRLVAQNTGGMTVGPDETFTTAPETCATDAGLCLPPPTCATDASICPPLPSCATDASLCPSPPPLVLLKCGAGYVKKVVAGEPSCVRVAVARRASLKCRRGYVKKKVRGKSTCVKVAHTNRANRKHGH